MFSPTEELWRAWCTATTCRSPSPNRRSPVGHHRCPAVRARCHGGARSGPRGQRRARPPTTWRAARGICGCGECGHPAATCFCTSMGTGPGVESGFDLALSELNDAGGHRFVLRVGTERGADVLARLSVAAATSTTWRPGTRWFLGRPGRCIASCERGSARPAGSQPGTPRWDEVASGVWPVEIARWCPDLLLQ